MEARKEREIAFHNSRFEQGFRGTDENLANDVQKYYSVAGASRSFYIKAIREGCAGKRVLEYGCGTGSNSFNLAMRQARVTGIDISEIAVGAAQQKADAEGIAGADFQVMDAEKLTFPDATFDLICGAAILHHLDLQRAIPELARTMKADGRGLFVEPLGHNPVFNLHRKRTPDVRTPDEHPLVRGDIRFMRRYFGKVEMYCFHLMSLMSVPLRQRRCFPRVLGLLDAMDATLFRVLPFMRWYAWTAVVIVSQPIHSAPVSGAVESADIAKRGVGVA
jgi:SAM-dependent methyltransferase